MSPQVVVAVVSAVVAVVGAVAAGFMTTWSAQRTRRYESLLEAQQRALSKAEQAEAVLSRYREPLLAAAHNLSSRLYNIVDLSYLAVYLHCGEDDQERYARNYTVYVLAEYLCWAEIIRRDMRFLDLGSVEGNRELVLRLNATRSAISDESAPRALRLFRGEQRAIGELMTISTDDPGSAGHESMGYVQFCARLGDDPAFAQWFKRLRDDMDDIAVAEGCDHSRLIVLHNRLTDLIKFLDPDCSRVPANRRDRLALPSARTATADTEQAR